MKSPLPCFEGRPFHCNKVLLERIQERFRLQNRSRQERLEIRSESQLAQAGQHRFCGAPNSKNSC